MSSLVRVHITAPTATVILQRPEKRNSLSRELIEELAQALSDLHQQRGVRAVILSGAGAAFCAGMDLDEIQATIKSEQSARQWADDMTHYQDLLEQMLRFPKPLIAAVDGPALATGLGLVLACDMAIGSQASSYGLPEVRRGLVSGLVAPLLVFRAGAGHAARLMLTGMSVDALRAREMGLIQEVLPSEQVWPRAQELAAQCAAAPPEALQLAKRLLNEMVGEHLAMQFATGAATSATARTTEAAHEGVAAFLEKRPPQWPS